MFRNKNRKTYVALQQLVTEVDLMAPDLALEPPPAPEASTSGRTRRRAS